MKFSVKNIIMFLFILLLVPIEINMNIYHYSFYLKAFLSVIYFFIFWITKPTKREVIFSIVLLIFNISTCFSDLIDGSISIPLFFSKTYPFGLYCGIMYYLNKNFDGFLYQMRNVGILISILFILILFLNIIQSKPITPILYFNRNGMQFYLLYNIGSILLYNIVRNKRTKKIDKLLVGVSIIGLFISGSATAAIIGVFILAFMFTNFKNINIFIYYIAYIIIWWLLVIGQNSDNFILKFIFKTFKKSSTFSNRLWRWQYSLEFIKNNWLWGQTNLLTTVRNKNVFFNSSTFNAHNGILQVFVHSGIFGIVTMFLIFVNFAKKVNKYMETKFYKYMVIVILSFLICSFTESAISNNILVLYMFILVAIFYKEPSKSNL